MIRQLQSIVFAFLRKRAMAAVNPMFCDGIMKFERALAGVPGAATTREEVDAMCPVVHKFGDGCYIRQITMPKGTLITSKIHKKLHPYFVLKGDCSVLTEKGVQRIKAPYSGITQPGTKRVLYMHEDTVWTTVHVTKHRDLRKIENEIIAEDFDEFLPSPEQLKQLQGG